jgi:hypothetical protein
MAYVKVDTSVPRNRKFVKAGPAPSWLWLCGNCYCQDALTDGFIPDEALPYLGVKNAAQLADHLVKAGLWHKEGDGYRVNDYLDHNRSASEVQAIKEERRKAGASGGKASGQARRWTDEPNGDSTLKQVASGESKQPANPVQISTKQSNAEQQQPLDVAFASFRDRYPPARRKGGLLVQQQFVIESGKAGGPAALLAALENHMASEQWQTPKLVPGMDTWLDEERWRQRLEPPSAKPKTWRPAEAS